MPSKRQRKKRAAAKAEVAKTHDGAHGRVQNSDAVAGGCTEHSMDRDATGGLNMNARVGATPEFSMMHDATIELDTDQAACADMRGVVPSMDAAQLQEFNMEMTLPSENIGHATPEYRQSAVREQQHSCQQADDAKSAVMLAISQLLQELQIAQCPSEWSLPTVQPLLMEVLNARTKKIDIARTKRQRRRENRKKK